jgi:DNA-directed RNA polymerase subunit alpha
VLIAQRPTLSEESISEFRSRFVIEPLEPGFGYTLGNSLRRTLLSSIPGAAVTSIRIDNIQHEFATIPGVKEDVVEIVLNIKNLTVSSEHDEPITAYLRKQGAGQVTAADISAPAGVEIHNPELVIATLNDKAKFELELTIERGRGYVSATQNRSEFSEAGQIPIDSIYSPVLNATTRRHSRPLTALRAASQPRREERITPPSWVHITRERVQGPDGPQNGRRRKVGSMTFGDTTNDPRWTHQGG